MAHADRRGVNSPGSDVFAYGFLGQGRVVGEQTLDCLDDE